MGVRTSDRRRVPGNPLGGVLRSTTRAARTVRRRTDSGQTPDNRTDTGQPDSGQTPPHVCPSGPVVLSAVLECDADSRAEWVFPTPLSREPVVTATPVGGEPLLATLEYAGPEGLSLLLWTLDGWPAPAGTDVHVIAVTT